MNKTTSMLLLAATALGFQGLANAQDAAGCPQLPANTALHWEHKSTGNADFCRALRADGSEAFGMYISAEATFDPDRSNREERGQIGDQAVTWYRAEIATRPNVEARETVMRLPDGRSAHVWLQANSKPELADSFQLTQSLRFGASGPQLAAGE